MEKDLEQLSKKALIALLQEANSKSDLLIKKTNSLSSKNELLNTKTSSLSAKNELLTIKTKDVTLQKAILEAQYKELETKYGYGQFQLEQLRRMIFGTKRERFIMANNPFQMQLPFEVLKEMPQEEEAPVNITYQRKKAKKRTIGSLNLPSHLPVEIINLEPKETIENRIKIGEEITDKLELVPTKLYIKRYVRPKYALKKKVQDTLIDNGNPLGIKTVIMADLPSFAIEKSVASNSLLAQLLIDKFLDHLPYYRQIERFKREGISISSSTINGWQNSLGHLLKPLYQAMKNTVLSQGYVQADESTIPVLDKQKKGKTHTGYHWVYYSPIQKMVLFDYRPSRSKHGPREMLKNFKGYLQTDGYAVYDEFAHKKDVTLVGCMAHARRYFEKALDYDKVKASHAMVLIQQLYAIERHCKKQEFTPEQRHAYRLDKAQPIMDTFIKWLIHNTQGSLPKSPLGKAITYTLKRWDYLKAYLYDGTLELDNNLVEGSIRTLAIGRKNYLFAGSHDAAKNAAMFYSFFGTCKKHQVNPYKWMKKILDIIPDYNAQKLSELFPQNLNLDQ